jgi:hypothetical protein
MRCAVSDKSFERLDLLKGVVLAAFWDGRDGQLPSPLSNFYKIIPRNGKICPFLCDQGCGIYNCMPFDCRLYPFTIVAESDGIYLGLHASICRDAPDKEWTENFLRDGTNNALKLIAQYGLKDFREYLCADRPRLGREKMGELIKVQKLSVDFLNGLFVKSGKKENSN